MRRVVFLTIGLLTLLVSCNQTGTKQQGVKKKTVQKVDTTLLRVAVTPTLDCLPLFVANDRGMFDAEGVKVRLVRYQAQMDQDTAIERGRVDGLTTDLVRAERLQQESGIGLEYTLGTEAQWQMVTNKMARIKQVGHLKDKMIAMSRFSATDLLADMVIDMAMLDSNSVFKIQVNDVDIRLGMLQNGIMDALLLPEPQATVARMAGAPVLFEPTDIRLGVLAFGKDAVKGPYRQGLVQALVTAYDRACDSINEHGVKSYRDVIMKYCKVRKQVVDSLPKELHYEHAQPPRATDIQRAKSWIGKQNNKQTVR